MFDQFNTDPHIGGVRWDKWIKILERLLEAPDIIEKAAHSANQKAAIDKRKQALLLHYAEPRFAFTRSFTYPFTLCRTEPKVNVV